MDLGLGGARALVGGGSGGLGGAIAAELIAEGARVGIIGRPGARLEAASTRLAALAVPADLRLRRGRPTPSRRRSQAFDGLDLLVVNSGGPPPGRFDDLDETAWRTAIDGTLWSALRLLRAALPHLRDGRDPAILVMLSSSAREPIPGLTTSNLIRPGLAGLIKSMVEEIVPVRINGLAPGRLGNRPHRPARRRPICHIGHARGGDPANDHGPDPARAVWRSGGARPGRGVPPLARGVLRHGRDRPGRRRDDPGAAVA